MKENIHKRVFILYEKIQSKIEKKDRNAVYLNKIEEMLDLIISLNGSDESLKWAVNDAENMLKKAIKG